MSAIIWIRSTVITIARITPRLGGAGTGKLRFAEIFGAAICAFDKLGANYRYLSVRRHALRRSLALAADKAPLSPPNGGFLLS